MFLIFLCQPTAEKLPYLRAYLIHIFLDEVCADVGGTGDEEEFLVGGAGGSGEGFLRHIGAVGPLRQFRHGVAVVADDVRRDAPRVEHAQCRHRRYQFQIDGP